MLTKKAKPFHSAGESLGFGSKEDGMKDEDETLEFERMGSVEKMNGRFLREPVSEESDGILGIGVQEEVGSGSDGVSQRSESLGETYCENGKAALDFDLNYPITDATTNANGYKIANHVIAIDSDSEEDNSLNRDDESHRGFGVGKKSSQLCNGRSESSSFGEENRFVAKKFNYGKRVKEKTQVYEDDEDKLEIGLGLLPFNPKSRY